jgi:hypothetical protein
VKITAGPKTSTSQLFQIFFLSSCEVIQDPYFVAILQELFDEMASDKTSPTGNQELLVG